MIARAHLDRIRVEPIAGTLDSTVILPGSKSLTNRAFIIAGLADGPSTLTGIGWSDDTEAMAEALSALGATVEVDGTTARIDPGAGLHRAAGPLDARMSGTSARFLLALLGVVGGGSLDGHGQLRSRPQGPLCEALRTLGCAVDADQLPLSVDGHARGGAVSIDASLSSQFISALLLIAPVLAEGLRIDLVGEVVSTPYIDMTISIMEAFGADVGRDGNAIEVRTGGYSGRTYAIEPDASTATYPLAAAAIVGGRVTVAGLGSGSVQGDADFAERVLGPMGADVHVTEDSIEVRGSGHLDALTVDLGDMSDTAPTFAALAACAHGTSTATGIGFIKSGKESNRVENPVAELAKLGIEGQVDPDGFTITGGDRHHGEVETYDDHRMAMSLALVGLRDTPVTVLDPACTAKTFPEFWDMVELLRAQARTKPRVLAIDGPAGSGKSTVAKRLAAELQIPHLDTGAMYRAVTTAVIESGVPLEDADAISAAARAGDIVVGRHTVLLDGKDVTSRIRDSDVTASVSTVASIPGVRHTLVEAQRAWAAARGAAVVEGRDIGSVVFPEATLKIYLSASVDERARRRAAETGETDLDAVAAAIAHRDHLDQTRETDPLTIAEGATVVDSTALTIDEVVETIAQQWRSIVEPAT